VNITHDRVFFATSRQPQPARVDRPTAATTPPVKAPPSYEKKQHSKKRPPSRTVTAATKPPATVRNMLRQSEEANHGASCPASRGVPEAPRCYANHGRQSSVDESARREEGLLWCVRQVIVKRAAAELLPRRSKTRRLRVSRMYVRVGSAACGKPRYGTATLSIPRCSACQTSSKVQMLSEPQQKEEQVQGRKARQPGNNGRRRSRNPSRIMGDRPALLQVSSVPPSLSCSARKRPCRRHARRHVDAHASHTAQERRSSARQQSRAAQRRWQTNRWEVRVGIEGEGGGQESPR